MNEFVREPQTQPEESELTALENDISRLKGLIAKRHLDDLIQLGKVSLPLLDSDLDELDSITVIERDIDYPQAGNKASVRISPRGEWLVDNGDSVATDLPDALRDYARATRDKFLIIEKAYWVHASTDEPMDAESREAYFEAEAVDYINRNKLSLMVGFRGELERVYFQLANPQAEPAVQ